MRQIDARNLAKILGGLDEQKSAEVLSILNELELITGVKWYPDADNMIISETQQEEQQWEKQAEIKASVESVNSPMF